MSSSKEYSSNKGKSMSYSISINGTSKNDILHVMLPVRGCDLSMKLYISNTYENQDHRFWKRCH